MVVFMVDDGQVLLGRHIALEVTDSWLVWHGTHLGPEVLCETLSYVCRMVEVIGR